MPGMQTPDLGAATTLYALLTGRLSQVQTGKVVDPATLQYSRRRVPRELDVGAGSAGCSCRTRGASTPDFTLNYGLRWEVNQPPFNHTGDDAVPGLREHARPVDARSSSPGN